MLCHLVRLLKRLSLLLPLASMTLGRPLLFHRKRNQSRCLRVPLNKNQSIMHASIVVKYTIDSPPQVYSFPSGNKLSNHKDCECNYSLKFSLGVRKQGKSFKLKLFVTEVTKLKSNSCDNSEKRCSGFMIHFFFIL